MTSIVVATWWYERLYTGYSRYRNPYGFNASERKIPMMKDRRLQTSKKRMVLNEDKTISKTA